MMYEDGFNIEEWKAKSWQNGRKPLLHRKKR